MTSSSSSPRKLSKQDGIDRLSEAREDLALILAGTFVTQQQVHRMLSITDDLWQAIAGESAPEIEVTPVIRRLRERVA